MRWCARSSVGRVGGEDVLDGVYVRLFVVWVERMCEMVCTFVCW